MNEKQYEECKNRILTFKELKYNWNDNGADMFSEKVINNSLKLLKYCLYEPEIFPTACNSIQFEFTNEDNEYFEVEVEKDGFSTFKIYKDNTERTAEYGLDEYYKIINHIKTFYNGKPKNVVVFTGSFNPPTIAHYNMIDSALSHKDFDYVFFALSNNSFLSRKQKRNHDWCFSERERIDMVLEMTYMHPKALILGVEQGYTYDVLCEVKSTYNCEQIYFACGSDKLNEIERWGKHNLLLTDFNFYVLVRNDNEKDVETKCASIFKNTHYIIGKDNEKFKNISATEVRKCIKQNQDFKGLVHENVYQYLKENNLL